MNIKQHLLIGLLAGISAATPLSAQGSLAPPPLPPPPPSELLPPLPPPPPAMWEHDRPQHGFLGIIMQMEREVSIEDGKETVTTTDKGKGKGVYVQEVSPESAAQAAGLQAGDIITAINGQPTPNPDALSDIIRRTKVGEQISISYLRNETSATTQATLQARTKQLHHWEHHAKQDMPYHCKDAQAGSKHCDPPNKARLGVMVETFDATLAQQEGLKTTSGAYITEVTDESAAEKAGLQEGDIITKIDGKDVLSHRDVISALSGFAPNDRVKINYIRDGKKNDTQATLQAAPRNESCQGKNRHKERVEKIIENFDWQEHMGEWQEQMDEWQEHMGEWQEKDGPLRRRVIIKNDGDDNEDRRVEKVIIIRDKNGEVITEDISPLIKDFDIEIGDEVMEDGNLTLNILIRDLETADQNVVKDVFTPATADNAKALSDKTLHIAVNNYPNPTEGTFTVSFYAPETGTLNVRVADAQGKLVFNETLEHFAGQYQKELDLSANTKGTYFLQITQNGKSLSKKVIVD